MKPTPIVRRGWRARGAYGCDLQKGVPNSQIGTKTYDPAVRGGYGTGTPRTDTQHLKQVRTSLSTIYLSLVPT